MVKKSDGTYRMCVDFRKVNASTKKDAYPMPRIDETLEKLEGSKFFSSMDAEKGYHQVPMDEASKPITAFTTPKGLFQYKRMPFGLTNAGATFQRMMNTVLGKLTWDQCMVFIDDIVVYSRSWDEHISSLRLVFEKLREAGITLKLAKCNFGADHVKFLGHVVSREGVGPDPEKIKAIRELELPTTLKALKSFLGMTGWLRKFIKDYAKIAAPMVSKLRGGNSKKSIDPLVHFCWYTQVFLECSRTKILFWKNYLQIALRNKINFLQQIFNKVSIFIFKCVQIS
jgi:hypothetical protein